MRILLMWRILFLFLFASFGINKLFLFLFVQKLATWIYSYSYSRDKLLFTDHSSGQRLIPSINKPKRIFFLIISLTIFGFLEKKCDFVDFFLLFFSFLRIGLNWRALVELCIPIIFPPKKIHIENFRLKKKIFWEFLIFFYKHFWYFLGFWCIFSLIFLFYFFFTFWNFRFFWNFGEILEFFFRFFDSFQS